ncbi:MAG: protein-glutamate O-methyltransferase CheR [Pseudomonadota bacterium]|uniref:CheR family methyltransferase n=1 Tax=unclassified Phenylobacterium TaxID=2640670 RepID=UPI0006F58656|nr:MULTISPECIES: protein-glutamate O-methyltransferase CheR [unclassified Phenylobacterium]KRB52319.1 chemotaxis protein CheR [Phenylobacterium sp. Root700]MBT9473877.1 protein-glutamate O-methyltransferase CheR [Phenylobacterium sp.]
MRVEDRELVAQLCAARAGVRVDVEKTYLIESRLGPVARREGFGSVNDLLTTLRARREDRLAWGIVEAMAHGETAFFRDREPFALFRDEVLPTLAKLRGGEPVRIWSAACASGQEVYSLAMVIEDERARLPGLKVELFGSDLSERQLEKAQSGLYTQFEVQRGLPIRQLVRHFEQDDEMWAISPRIRQMVRWRRINLVADLSTAGRFDVIFCRYVLSSLVEPMKTRLLENLARALGPEGFLFLGRDETATGLGDAFQPVQGRTGLYARNPAFRVAA